jgi:hypothetical protein
MAPVPEAAKISTGHCVWNMRCSPVRHFWKMGMKSAARWWTMG